MFKNHKNYLRKKVMIINWLLEIEFQKSEMELEGIEESLINLALNPLKSFTYGELEELEAYENQRAS